MYVQYACEFELKANIRSIKPGSAELMEDVEARGVGNKADAPRPKLGTAENQFGSAIEKRKPKNTRRNMPIHHAKEMLQPRAHHKEISRNEAQPTKKATR